MTASHSNKEKGATGDTAAQPEYLDAAPYARVASWDPSRMDGAQAKRIESFGEEDVFLGTPLSPDSAGAYEAPRYADERACIGLEWDTRRHLGQLEIEFSPGSALPRLEETRAEFWDAVGFLQSGSAWQGKWSPLEGSLTKQGDRIWRLEIRNPAQKAPLKIRWIFPRTDGPILIQNLRAQALSTMQEAEIALEAREGMRGRARIGITNGWIRDGESRRTTVTWDLAAPLNLTVRHTETGKRSYSASDRAVLRFEMEREAFGIAVEDILQRRPVWMERPGIFAAQAPAKQGLEEYLASIAGKKTILDEVRAMPEQTREQAMAKTHYNPKFDVGDIMLSLACDNNKFIVEREGRIGYAEDYVKEKPWSPPPCLYYITPQYGRSRILFQRQDWGKLGVDTGVDSGKPDLGPPQIGEKKYARGLGHHANGEIQVDLRGEFDRFETEVGLQFQPPGNKGSVVFSVLVDGEERFNSGIMRWSDPARPVSLSVEGAKVLTLKVGDAGDGIGNDAAIWAEARLLAKGSDAPQYISAYAKEKPTFRRQLAEGWLPAPVSSTTANGLLYTQRTFVVPLEAQNLPSAPLWLNGKPAAVAEVTIENPTAEALEARAALTFEIVGTTETLALSADGERPQALVGNQVVAILDASAFGAPRTEVQESTWIWSAMIPANSTRHLYLLLPAWKANAGDAGQIAGREQLFERFRSYWHAIMADSMQISLPDKWLENVVRANQAHILLAARNEEEGKRAVPWIASLTYRACIDSEGNSPLRAMIDFGHFEFARRAFEFYFGNIKPEGFMTTGYTLMGTGWNLWTLAEYLEKSGDRAWFEKVADDPLRMARWIMEQRKLTQRLLPGGQKAQGYGLMPPGVMADWACYAPYFAANAHYQRGLEMLGCELAARGKAQAEEILADAEEYREDILRAFRAARGRAPAVALRNGSWAPFAPTAANYAGPVGEIFPGEDASRSWCYDVELGSHHLAALGVLRPDDGIVDDMLNYLEDVEFLKEGWHGYPESLVKGDWFNMGGFAKVQPYYARNAEIYALRDDVKPFLRSYWNALAATIDGEMLSIYEHFAPSCINKTHETGYFLHQTRLMLLMERGEELWLAPLVPQSWLEDGKAIEVQNAPTRFGPVSYRIASHLSQKYVEARIAPPRRSKETPLILRLRHPAGEEIQRVTVVEGECAATVDEEKQTVRATPKEPATLRIEFGKAGDLR